MFTFYKIIKYIEICTPLLLKNTHANSATILTAIENTKVRFLNIWPLPIELRNIIQLFSFCLPKIL